MQYYHNRFHLRQKETFAYIKVAIHETFIAVWLTKGYEELCQPFYIIQAGNG